MQTVYIGNTLVNDVMLGSQRMDDVLQKFTSVPTIPTGGLIALFDSTNATSYPGSGNIWYDISGKGLQAIAVSGSTFPSFDSVDKTFNFNGTSNAVSAVFVTSSLIAQTQIVWLKLGTNTPSGTGIGNIGSAPDQSGAIPETVKQAG